MSLPLTSKVKQQRLSLKNAYLWKSLQAIWHHRLGQKDEAIRNWVDLLNQDSSNPRFKEARYLIEAEAFQEVRDYLEGLSSNQMEDLAEINYLLTRCYLGQGLIPQAKEKVEQAIQAKPQNATYWDLLADCYLELGDWQQAIKALDNSLRAAPKNAETIYRLGIIYAYHGEYLEALRCFQGSCQLRPHQSLYWEMKAEMHLHLDQLLDACTSFDKALRYGGTPDLAARLAYCYVQSGQIKKGIHYYEFTLKYEPDHYDALSNLAAVYQNKDRSLDALKLLERAKNIHANDPILLNNLAYTLVHMGRVRKALEHYREALELAPDHPLILYNLSVCLARKGNWQEGIDSLNKLIEMDPNHSAGWALLGTIYDQMENYDTAIDCFNKSLKLA